MSATAPPPPSPPFQFSLRTLLLLFVVLGSSMAVFGAWGILVFGLVVGLAATLRNHRSGGTARTRGPARLPSAGYLTPWGLTVESGY